jgi:hypothetical protein
MKIFEHMEGFCNAKSHSCIAEHLVNGEVHSWKMTVMVLNLIQSSPETTTLNMPRRLWAPSPSDPPNQVPSSPFPQINRDPSSRTQKE